MISKLFEDSYEKFSNRIIWILELWQNHIILEEKFGQILIWNLRYLQGHMISSGFASYDFRNLFKVI